MDLTRLFRSMIAVAVFGVGAAPRAARAQQHPMRSDSAARAQQAMQMHPMRQPAGVPMQREGSGTSWQPDATPMRALHASAGAWELMLHGNAFIQYVHARGARGDDQLGSINWVMGMASRPLAGGALSLRAMLSAEPLTVGECGYPLLLQTGEECEGSPIHDRQHPHDLFMELAATYRRPIGSGGTGIELYGGPVGEPALGPVAFPHRASAFADPLAPITHHWLDATHISFGVVTAGVHGRLWKIEGSAFNGREPDADRWDFDLAPLDSYSARLWLLPSERWALQLSAGHLAEAEPAHEGAGRTDVDRITASAMYVRPLANGDWATTAAFGRNVEESRGSNALLFETLLNVSGNAFFARGEWVRKSAHDLVLEDPALEDETFGIVAIAAGYARYFRARSFDLGVGARAAVHPLPDRLEPAYGSTSPASFTLFLQLAPATMQMEMPMETTPMSHDGGR